MYMKYFSMAEARSKFAKLLDLSSKSEEPIVITRNGEPTAVLINVDEYESMTETLEIMSDPELYAEIMEYTKNPRGQKLYNSEEVWAELQTRLAREKDGSK